MSAVEKAGSNSPRVKSERLWADILSTARFGAVGDTGMSRLALSEADREVRDWFAAECRALECEVEVDRIGNMFATYPGRDMALESIAVGSHLDTQPGGGRFDGILGVLAGVEIVRALRDSQLRLNRPLTVVNWTNEEGSRFSPAMMGSGVFCGVQDLARMEAVADKTGLTVAEALRRIGYRGERDPGYIRFSSYLELHIEQGPVLEAGNCQIGAVTGLQGVCWLDVRVSGIEAHAGAQPMHMRQDALIMASHIALAVEACAVARPPGVGTVGFVRAEPNSRNVVPGQVQLEIDLRHPDDTELTAMEAWLIAEIHRIAPTAQVQRVWRKPPVVFDRALVDIVSEAAASIGYSVKRMVSGGGHDAGHVAGMAPSAMIFIPSQAGLSHNVSEYSSPQQCAEGAEVMLRAIMEVDRRLTNSSSLSPRHGG